MLILEFQHHMHKQTKKMTLPEYTGENFSLEGALALFKNQIHLKNLRN